MNTPLQGEITVSDENIIANICLKINRKEIKTERMFLNDNLYISLHIWGENDIMAVCEKNKIT